MASAGLRGLLAPGGLLKRAREAGVGAWAAYNRSLITRPLATKVATAAGCTLLGDGLAQWSTGGGTAPPPGAGERGGDVGLAAPQGKTAAGVEADARGAAAWRYDFSRLGRMLLWAMAVGAPVAHFWFAFLDRTILPAAPRSPASIAAKLLLDQGIMAPLGTAGFLAAMKVMEGKPEDAVPEVQTKLLPVMCANYALWPLANAVNFALVPPQLRVTYINVLSVLWVAFISHMAAHRPAEDSWVPPKQA